MGATCSQPRAPKARLDDLIYQDKLQGMDYKPSKRKLWTTFALVDRKDRDAKFSYNLSEDWPGVFGFVTEEIPVDRSCFGPSVEPPAEGEEDEKVDNTHPDLWFDSKYDMAGQFHTMEALEATTSTSTTGASDGKSPLWKEGMPIFELFQKRNQALMARKRRPSIQTTNGAIDLDGTIQMGLRSPANTPRSSPPSHLEGHFRSRSGGYGDDDYGWGTSHSIDSEEAAMFAAEGELSRRRVGTGGAGLTLQAPDEEGEEGDYYERGPGSPSDGFNEDGDHVRTTGMSSSRMPRLTLPKSPRSRFRVQMAMLNGMSEHQALEYNEACKQREEQLDRERRVALAAQLGISIADIDRMVRRQKLEQEGRTPKEIEAIENADKNAALEAEAVEEAMKQAEIDADREFEESEARREREEAENKAKMQTEGADGSATGQDNEAPKEQQASNRQARKAAALKEARLKAMEDRKAGGAVAIALAKLREQHAEQALDTAAREREADEEAAKEIAKERRDLEEASKTQDTATAAETQSQKEAAAAAAAAKAKREAEEKKAKEAAAAAAATATATAAKAEEDGKKKMLKQIAPKGAPHQEVIIEGTKLIAQTEFVWWEEHMLLDASESSVWSEVTTEDGYSVYEASVEDLSIAGNTMASGISVFRADIFVPDATPLQVFEAVYDLNVRRTWDDAYDANEVKRAFEGFPFHNDMWYCKSKDIPFVSSRDWLMVRGYSMYKDAATLIKYRRQRAMVPDNLIDSTYMDPSLSFEQFINRPVNKSKNKAETKDDNDDLRSDVEALTYMYRSVEHPSVPEVKKVVRALSHGASFIYRVPYKGQTPSEEKLTQGRSGTMFVVVSANDGKVSGPKMFINKAGKSSFKGWVVKFLEFIKKRTTSGSTS